MKRIKLLSAWTSPEPRKLYKAGTVLEISDDAEADELIAAGVAEAFEEKAATVAVSASAPSGQTATVTLDQIKAMGQEIAQQIVAGMPKATPNITTGDSPEDKLAKDGMFGFKNSAEWFELVVRAAGGDGSAHRAQAKLHDNYSKVAKALPYFQMQAKAVGSDELTTLNDALGGFLVPPEISRELFVKPVETGLYSTIREASDFRPMSSNMLKINAVQDDTHASENIFGGVLVRWTGEKRQGTPTPPKFERINVMPNKLMALIPVTQEELTFAPTLAATLSTLIGQAVQHFLIDKFLNGDGSGQVQGALDASNGALIAVAKETGQSADTIERENIVKMYSRCMNPGNAIWIANYDTYPQLAALQVGVGTGGVLTFQTNDTSAPPSMLLGRPVYLTEHMATLGDQGDIALIDWMGYVIGEVGAMSRAENSAHLRFDYDEVVFKWTQSIDGRSKWRTAQTPRYGSNTRSPFVTLAERA